MSERCFKRPRIKRVLRKKTLCVYVSKKTANNSTHVFDSKHAWCLCAPPTFAGEAVRRDPRQAIFTDVAKGGPCMGAGVPVVHP